MPVIELLPVDFDEGFPQTVRVSIENLSFNITYAFNGYDESLTIVIVREFDEREVVREKAVPFNGIPMINRENYLPKYYILPFDTSREGLEIALVRPTDENIEEFDVVVE